MRQRSRIARGALLALVALGLAAEVTAQSNFGVTNRYTAQRRPRVAVFKFADTNRDATQAQYGRSVEAMLVTFLKRKSQFVVVERQDLDPLLEEWHRSTNILPTDPSSRELLEKLDAVILGSVTLLPVHTEAQIAGTRGKAASGQSIQGQRIEIDAKLLSRADGRIIAAAQRSGPVACLRSIVERLGVALEQEFLRPYYGKIKFNLSKPENVRVFLTPVLLEIALDEEKPPLERSATVKIGPNVDRVQPWTTDPTSYTIENLLSGWYSMRLERPGYEGLGSDNSEWVARQVLGKTQVYQRQGGRPLSQVAGDLRRFIVRVDPLDTETIDGDSLGFEFRKLNGSIAPLVKRQYVDEDYVYTPQRVVLIGRDEIELNRVDRPDEFAEDESCDLFEEELPHTADFGRTYIATGQKFDLDLFVGGKLVIEDYRGESIPVGRYDMALWEPSYRLFSTKVGVRDRDSQKPTHSVLQREFGTVKVSTTGPEEPHRVLIEGSATGFSIAQTLDFSEEKTWDAIPVDLYVARTEVPGLTGWRREIKLEGSTIVAPVYDPDLDDRLEKERKQRTREEENHVAEEGVAPSQAEGSGKGAKLEEVLLAMPLRLPTEPAEKASPSSIRAKTRLAIGGRLGALGLLSDLPSEELYIDHRVELVLSGLLPHEPSEVEDKRHRRARLASAWRAAQALNLIRPASAEEAEAGPQNATGGSSEKPAQKVDAASRRRLARQYFADLLNDIDLLVLDNVDMARLRNRPEVAAIISRYVASGGALFAFASEEGEYEEVFGASLAIKSRGKRSTRFELVGGEVPGVEFHFRKKRVRVKSRRILPELEQLSPASRWRVISFTQGRRNPRIVERGGREKGGYVAVWCDDPFSFRSSRSGSRVPDVERARAEVERHVLDWARFLMYRRYDKLGEERRRAEDELAR